MAGTIRVFHGSNHDFEKFCFVNVGKEEGIDGAGYGLYFTEQMAEAISYGDIVYECTINLKQPIDNLKVTLRPADVAKLLTWIYEFGEKSFNYYTNCKVQPLNIGNPDLLDNHFDSLHDDIINSAKTDTDIIRGLIAEGCPVKDMMDALANFGYTHTVDRETPEDDTITHYIVFDCDAITILRKLNVDDLHTEL